MSYGTEIISGFIDALFVEEIKCLDTVKRHLIVENHTKGNPPGGFLFQGQFWTAVTDTKVISKMQKKTLHRELWDEAKHLITAHKKLKTDRIGIAQGLSLVLRPCENEQDVRDALPDTFLQFLPDTIQVRPRTRDEAWSIKDKPLLHHEFAQTEARMSYYVANRLLF